MKLSTNNYVSFLFLLSLLLLTFNDLSAYPSGVSGFTMKTSTSGCGTCHSTHGSANTSVLVQISGPSSLQPGGTGTYTAVITGGSGTDAGVDIAASSGTLDPVSSSLKIQNGELTQTSRQSYSAGKYTFTFTYTAPSAEGNQTLYATGMSARQQWNFSPDFTVSVSNATDVRDRTDIKEFSLKQNYPNPFNPATIISYELPEAADVKLTVTDILGREVAQLVNSYQQAGSYNINFDASALANGIYLYRIKAGSYVSIKKMTLIK